VIVDPVIDRPEDFPGNLCPSGSKWKLVGTSPPSKGTLLGVLQSSRQLDEFSTAVITDEEIASLGVKQKELRVDHYIKADGLYYVPNRCAWGVINWTPYLDRGWCCAEFSCALKNGRIVNINDPLVVEVLSSRSWPTTVEDYAVMMDEGAARPVHFTSKGDGIVVLYNFFKMTAGLRFEAPTLLPRLSRTLTRTLTRMSHSTRVEPDRTSKVLAPEESEAEESKDKLSESEVTAMDLP